MPRHVLYTSLSEFDSRLPYTQSYMFKSCSRSPIGRDERFKPAALGVRIPPRVLAPNLLWFGAFYLTARKGAAKVADLSKIGIAHSYTYSHFFFALGRDGKFYEVAEGRGIGIMHLYDHGTGGDPSRIRRDCCSYCAKALDELKGHIGTKEQGEQVAIKNKLTNWELYETALKAPGISRMLIYGPPGVGKTHTPCEYFQKNKIDYVQVTATEGDMVSEYRGMWVPAGDHFDWFNGLLIHAWTANKGKGMPVVVNEVDKFPQECMSILHAILDNPNIAHLRLPNGETVRPGPNFRFIGTMNGVPSDLSEALQSRFQVKLLIDEPHQSAIDLLDEDMRSSAKNLIMATDVTKRLNYRQLLTFKEIRKDLGDEVAAQLVFGKQANNVLGVFKVGS